MNDAWPSFFCFPANDTEITTTLPTRWEKPLGNTDAERRFWQRVVVIGDCWIWNGVGRNVRLLGKRGPLVTVDRAAHELVIGEAPPRGLHVVRSCQSAWCVYPGHTSYPGFDRSAINRRYDQRKQERLEAQRAADRSTESQSLIEVTEKLCRDCGEIRPAGEFRVNKALRSGLTSYCRRCLTIRTRRSRGVTVGADAVAPPDQLCEVCQGLPGRRGLFLDHDHSTGHFRGWLCHHCNAGIGHFDDDPERMQNAIAYLRARASVAAYPRRTGA